MKAILFDLFGTVVLFKPQVPVVEVSGERWRTTMGWLRETAASTLPGVAFEDLLSALLAVTQEMTRNRPPEYREVPSRERFRRALAELGIGAQEAPALAERLSLVHMQHLASQVVMPAEHRHVLATLACRYRLALVSNFDHAATARRVLSDHQVADYFDPIVISEEMGRRKPHPAIFEAALAPLGYHPAEAIFVGDSIGDDIVGAHNAGLPSVWINPDASPIPLQAPQPRAVVRRLSDLLDLDL
ncbi:MAG: HAD family hydrolase [Deltaproteobacteria bacterium]|nr:HAD family hydrolase [Deltaproteobacteria bacterium]